MRNFASALILIITLVGCATFPGKQIAKLEKFPIASQKPSIAISLAYKMCLNGQPSTVMAVAAEAQMQKKVLERFTKSGLYSSVTPGSGNADINLTIELTDTGEANLGMAFLTGFTLYLLPSSAKDTFKLSAITKLSKGRAGKNFVLQDSITMHQQILLLPVMPFKMLPVVGAGVINNMFDTLALQVYQSAQ
jgi:hypothetical protein